MAVREDRLQRFGETCEATFVGASETEAVSEAPLPVMDMRFFINHLNEIRREAGDFSLKNFSDYWAPDNRKTTPNGQTTGKSLRTGRTRSYQIAW
jgi:hypothetical protein